MAQAQRLVEVQSPATPDRLAAVVTLKPRHDLHLLRKIWHTGMGLLMVGIYQSGMARWTAVTILGSVLTAFLILESARIRIPAFNATCLKLWGPLLRKDEENRISGLPYYVGATLLSIALFPKPVAVLAVMFLAIGDPIASLVGILFGGKSRRFANGKSWVGTAAGVAACMAVALLYVNGLALPWPKLLAITAIGGAVGGTVELLPLEIDDNFSIPVISGFFLWLLFMALGV
ncbi:MAG TPA: SEC59/DGK1/VTE5 family protein [Bdellovibrionota bacterium]|nr:SEC59/DGK1/VTE5 family protein [Bdellovibrionota bacterium]